MSFLKGFVMEFTQFFQQLTVAEGLLWVLHTILWSMISIFVAEFIRSAYHVLHHQVDFLYELFHKYHHLAYLNSYRQKDRKAWRKAIFLYDLPEASSVVLTGLLVMNLVNASGYATPAMITGMTIGGIHSLNELGIRILRIWDVKWAIEADDNHQPGATRVPPSQGLVNFTYHWRHHYHDERAYFSGFDSVLDRLLGTAVSMQGKRVATVGHLGTLGRPLRTQLTEAGAEVLLDDFNTGKASYSDVDVLILSALSPKSSIDSLHAQMQNFLKTIQSTRDVAIKEVWVVLPETVLALAAGSSTEVKQQVFSTLVSLASLKAPCVMRKIIVAQPKDPRVAKNLTNRWVTNVRRDLRTIVPGRPLVGGAYLLKETLVNAYLRYRNQAKPVPVNTQSLTRSLNS